MEILYMDDDCIAVVKPPFMPSQSDLSGDEDLMGALAKELKTAGERDELYLIHRLDRVVGGVLLLARNKRAAATLSQSVAQGMLKKEYLAVLDGALDECGTLEDYVIRDGVTSRAHCVPKERRGAKYARLTYETLRVAQEDERRRALVRVRLGTGRFHQIRVQFSTRGTPLLGDGKYGSRCNRTKVALFAYRLTFPTKTGEKCVRAMPPLMKYPWNLFESEVYENV